MPVIKTDKKTIIKKSIHLFKVHGYYKTSMADLAKACGLVKGSIYHHFKGKQELGLECLKYIHKLFNEKILVHAYNPSMSDKQQLDKLTDDVEQYFLNSEGGCLLGNWTLDVINDIPEFKQEIQKYFKSWEDAVTNILLKEYTQDKARSLSQECIANTQGALMMMRLYNDEDIFLRANIYTKSLLK